MVRYSPLAVSSKPLTTPPGHQAAVTALPALLVRRRRVRSPPLTFPFSRSPHPAPCPSFWTGPYMRTVRNHDRLFEHTNGSISRLWDVGGC